MGEYPYAGTSGWSGTDTSRERAVSEDESGTTAKRQAETLSYLRQVGAQGMTVTELRHGTGWHHGKASGLLSVLHKVGRVERLAEKRGRCHVYVLPEYVNGRDTQPHGRRDTVTIPREEYDALVRQASQSRAWQV